MSEHPTSMIVHGMRRLKAPHQSARDTADLRETICRLFAIETHFCALIGTKAG